MKKVLIISFAFPPNGSVGTYRIAKFCKFFPEFNWEPTVLTLDESTFYNYDQTLDSDIKHVKKVIKTPKWYGYTIKYKDISEQNEPNNPSKPVETYLNSLRNMTQLVKRFLRPLKHFFAQLLFFPDRHSGWIIPSIIKAYRELKASPVDVILSTTPPSSGHIIALALSKLTGIPFIVDYRDLWTLNEAYKSRNLSTWFKKLDSITERAVLKNAAAVVTSSPIFTKQLQSLTKPHKFKQFYTITNGLDDDDFTDITIPPREDKLFRLLHLGTIYGSRNPEAFFACCEYWLSQNPEIVCDISVDFIGDNRDLPELNPYPLTKRVLTLSPPIRKQKALEKLWNSDILLLILGFSEDSKGVIPAKTFEYLHSRTPIIALLPKDGAAEDILLQGDSVRIYSEMLPELEKASSYLMEKYLHWQVDKRQNNSHFSPQISVPDFMNRRSLTKKMSAIMDAVIIQ